MRPINQSTAGLVTWKALQGYLAHKKTPYRGTSPIRKRPPPGVVTWKNTAVLFVLGNVWWAVGVLRAR